MHFWSHLHARPVKRRMSDKIDIIYMAKQENRGYDSSRQADAEIEITPEMLKAGQSALSAWETSNDPYSANAVRSIYLAMRRLSGGQDLSA